MTQTLEQRAKVYYHCQVDPEEISKFRDGDLEIEEATIREAYFGRHPTPGPFTLRTPLGLNIWIDYKSYGSAGATYTRLEDIEGIMDDLGAMNTEDLKGKKVLAYSQGQRLIGISAYKNK